MSVLIPFYRCSEEWCGSPAALDLEGSR